MKNLKAATKKGFSLVELLVVIAVIGVIAAIAIPAMTNVFENSKTAKAKRNAQSIASAFSAARAAGWAPAAPDDGAAGIAALSGGGTGTGNFSTTTFRVKLDSAEQTAAAAHLTYVAGSNDMTYDATGGNG